MHYSRMVIKVHFMLDMSPLVCRRVMLPVGGRGLLTHLPRFPPLYPHGAKKFVRFVQLSIKSVIFIANHCL